MQLKQNNWPEVLKLARTVNDHYSMWEEQQAAVFKYCLEVPAGGIIVELGVAYGKTSVVMATAAKRVGAQFFAVDNFGLVGTEAEYRERLKLLQLPVTLLVGRTQEVAWNLPIDLILIDAGHDEANIRPDCERWLPFVKPGGVAIFHDYEQGEITREHPHWAVKFYADKNTLGWADLAHIKQLKIKRKP